VHSETKKTPLEFWAENCHAVGAEPRELDVLLLVAATRVLTKPSINYGNRRYWHLDFAQIPVGSEVEIRAQPDYMRPDTIEVFYEKRWICSAFAHDSVKGRAVTGKQVLQAQRQQMKRIKGTINEKKAVLHNADLEIKSPLPYRINHLHRINSLREISKNLLQDELPRRHQPTCQVKSTRCHLQNKEIPRGTKRLRLVKIRISVCRSKGARNDQYQ
jgi:hypothetical protein